MSTGTPGARGLDKLNDAITQRRIEILGNPRPSIRYLAFALLLDYMVLVWIFVSNDMHGKILLIGGPVVSFVGAVTLAWFSSVLRTWSQNDNESTMHDQSMNPT